MWWFGFHMWLCKLVLYWSCYNVNALCVEQTALRRFRFTVLFDYRQTSSIRRAKYRNSNVARLLLQFSLPNPLKPGVNVVGGAPTGDAPTTSEISTILWSINVRFIFEVWRSWIFLFSSWRSSEEYWPWCDRVPRSTRSHLWHSG